MKDKNSVAVFSTGEMKDNAFADKLMGAVTKAGEKTTLDRAVEVLAKGEVAPAPEALLDLSKIEVSEVFLPTLEGSKEKIAQEAEGGKQWAEAAGAKIVQLKGNLEKIGIEIEKIERDPNSKFSSTAQNLLVHWRKAEVDVKAKLEQILSVKNDALKSHMEFSALLEEIRGTDPVHLGEVREVMSRLIKMGRYRLVPAAEIETAIKSKSKWPSGAIFFEGRVYFSIVSDAKSNGQRALEAELRKLVDAAKMSKAAAIKTRGNADLTGFEGGKPGMYYLCSPKRTEGDRKFSEGHVLVELRDVNKGKFDWKDGKKVFRVPFVVIEAKDAIGSLSWMVSNRWIPHYWVKMGKVITKEDKRLEQEDFDRAVRMIRTLRALYGVWHKCLNLEAAKSKDEKPEGPTVNAVADTDMTGVVVETKPVTGPTEPAKKPTKKSKK